MLAPWDGAVGDPWKYAPLACVTLPIVVVKWYEHKYRDLLEEFVSLRRDFQGH